MTIHDKIQNPGKLKDKCLITLPPGLFFFFFFLDTILTVYLIDSFLIILWIEDMMTTCKRMANLQPTVNQVYANNKQTVFSNDRLSVVIDHMLVFKIWSTKRVGQNGSPRSYNSQKGI